MRVALDRDPADGAFAESGCTPELQYGTQLSQDSDFPHA
jgi:hypothetical protein